MKLKLAGLIGAILLTAGGCGAGGGAPEPFVPPPDDGGGIGAEGALPPPTLGANCDAGDGDNGMGGIWIGEPQDGSTDRMLVAETGEFRWLSPDGWSHQVFGTFQFDGTDVSTTDAIWVDVIGLTWLETGYFPINMSGTLDEQGELFLEFDLPVAFDTPAPHETASFSACDTLYDRDSSLANLAGTYISGGSTTLTIDDQGEIFYQQSSCAGSGKAELIDPDFNMYRMEITIEGCTGNTVHAPGRLFSGLAYLSDSGDGFTNDVIEFGLSSANDESVLVWSRTARK